MNRRGQMRDEIFGSIESLFLTFKEIGSDI
jgi:hypothetical protein